MRIAVAVTLAALAAFADFIGAGNTTAAAPRARRGLPPARRGVGA